MRKLLTIMALSATSLSVAADADDYYEKYNKAYHSTIEKESAKLKDAKKEHNENVIAVTKKYMAALEKVLTLYTKEGKLEDAIEVRDEIAQLKDLLAAAQPRKPAKEEDAKVEDEKLPELEFSGDIILKPLKKGVQVFNNRRYVWRKIPDLPVSQFTATGSGVKGSYKFKVQNTGYVYIAGVASQVQHKWTGEGWEATGATLSYKKGSLAVYRKRFRMMERVEVQKMGFATIVLVK